MILDAEKFGIRNSEFGMPPAHATPLPIGRGVLRGATEYEEPPFALLAGVLVNAPEYEEPPLALLASAME
jgi:hypothetical protein